MKIKKTGCLAWIVISFLWILGVALAQNAMGLRSTASMAFMSFSVYIAPIIIGVILYFYNCSKAFDYIKKCKKDFQEMGYTLDLDRNGAYGKAICADFTQKKILLIEKDKINKVINADEVLHFRFRQKEANSTLVLQINDPHFPLFEIEFLMAGKAAEYVASQLAAM